MRHTERILIAGLTAAAALRQRGLQIDLVERSPAWAAAGGGIAVQPNGMRVLHRLGLGAAAEQAGARIRRWQIRDRQGGVLCEIDLEALWGDVGAFIGIERARLQDVLRSGVAAGTCRLGTRATALRQDDRGVAVEFSDGAAACYDLVLGADGIHSRTRRPAVGGTLPVYTGQMVWRSVASMRSPEPDAVQFWLGEGSFFGLCPVGRGRTYGFGNVTMPRFRDPTEGRLERLRKRFAGYDGPVRDYLDSLDCDGQIHCGPIERLDGDHRHVRRIVLIGDAAHASSPMMGQGGAMAMEDALVLADILHSAEDLAPALEAFAARRAPRVGWVQRESAAIGELFRKPPAVRNAALREHGKTAFHERFRPLTAPP